MRRLGLAIVLIALSSMLGAATASAAPRSVFEGAWSSTDPVDGSTQHLYVVGGTNVQMTYVDEHGTTCVEIAAPTVVFTGQLTGRIQGDDLFAWFKQGGCGRVLVISASIKFAWTFHYDRTTDTLFGAIEDGPATWYRD
ncbi:MAG TPA: hypothetical protein VM451_09590 [Candidatus Limnocylindria bacterium]|nr:hypothetical protein [Candidatus Limnocylindria bacterium]